MKVYTQLFTVTGFGTFPYDMLRYDGCYPHSQQDVSEMENTSETRSVTLRRVVFDKPREPEIARWNSFLWSVDRESIQTTPVRG